MLRGFVFFFHILPILECSSFESLSLLDSKDARQLKLNRSSRLLVSVSRKELLEARLIAELLATAQTMGHLGVLENLRGYFRIIGSSKCEGY